MDPSHLNLNTRHADTRDITPKKSDKVAENSVPKELKLKMQGVSSGLSNPRAEKEKINLDSFSTTHLQLANVDPVLLAESAARLRGDLMPFFMTFVGSGGKHEKMELFSGDNISPGIPLQEIRRLLARIEDGANEGGRRQFVVHNDHIAANQGQIEFEGEEFDVVVRDDIIDQAVAKIEEYQYIKAVLSLAKVQKATENGIKGAKTKSAVSEHHEGRPHQTITKKKEVDELGSKMAEAATIEGLRKEKRKAEKREQEKDDLKDMINREVVREEQKKWDMRK